ncbi:MAG TPA: protein translocase subunit SecF [Candidatus Fimivivens sp.]|nr:protein translocase subunit SecF [Candidatus Fimivivens sp.]
MLNIIGIRKYTYWASGILALFSIAAIAVFGLRLGLDFKGGTLIQVRFAKTPVPQVSEIHGSLSSLDLRSLTVQMTGDNGAIIRFLASDDIVNGQVLAGLKTVDPGLSVVQSDFIGASVSDDIRKKAINGTIISVLAIAAYIAFAFRKVSHPIGSWDYGWGAVIALAHDLLITTGFFALFGRFMNVEVGVPFIAALLTILGYSVNDTIVVYDRIRENLLRSGAKSDFEGIVNRSVNETMSRSINTSLTVLIVLAAVAAFGGEGVRWFAIALLLGVSFGTYSSIFVASALLVSRYRMRTR